MRLSWARSYSEASRKHPLDLIASHRARRRRSTPRVLTQGPATDHRDAVTTDQERVELRAVGAGGFEPPTSSVSRKRSPPELSARAARIVAVSRRGPESNRCARLCRPLPNHSATPPNEGPSLAAACDGPGCPRRQRTGALKATFGGRSAPETCSPSVHTGGVHGCRCH